MVSALPLATHAQTPLTFDAATENQKNASIGGTATIDIIRLRAIGPGTPLRFGNVVPGSERVQLDGQRLAAGVDYSMDYATGVVYLMRAQREGQSLTVSYRYGPKVDAKAVSPFAGLGGFKFDLVPGGLKMLMGLGITERATDGSVLQGNVFGFNNSMKFGSSKLSGLYLYGERLKTDNRAGLNFDPNAKGDATTEEGKSQLILQSLQSNLLGGSAQFDYQDISKNFTNFGSAKEAGYDDAAIQRLQKEKGFTRFGMSLKDVKFGSLGLSQSYRSVEDGKNSITWRSFGMAQGGLKVNWSSQQVAQGFTRFADLGEADRDQLGREQGMSRQNLSGEFAQKMGKLSYSSSSIRDDASGQEIHRTEWGLDTSRIKFNLGQQEVDTGFTRMPSLMGNEQAMYGREAGLHRQWMSLQAALLGKGQPLTFSQSLLANKNGDGFMARDMAYTGKAWSIVHSERNADAKFGSLSAMTDAEVDGHVKSIAAMYGANVPTSAADRQPFVLSQGLSRDFTSLSAQPFKNWKVDFNQLDLKGHADSGKLTTAALASKNVNFSYRREELGRQFTELASMMQFEQQRLGTIAGLDRTDLGLSLQLGGKKKLELSKMSANAVNGDANRSTLAYTDKKIDVQVATREVASGFDTANQLVDAEKDLLQSLRGFKERDAKVKWSILPTLNLDASLQDEVNQQTNEVRRLHQLNLDWTPNGTTKLQYQSLEQKNPDPLSTLFATSVQRLGLEKHFGKYGVLKILDERQTFDESNPTLSDFHRQYLSYETKLDARTSVKTEQTRTSYENGDKEDISANTLSTTLTKRMGVAVTDVSVDRKGDDRDEKKRNYGFWYDFGNGLLFSYGYARQLSGETTGTMNSTVSLGQKPVNQADQVGNVGSGSINNLSVGAAYGVNEWDQDSRTQSFSNIAVSNKKPFRFGRITDLKFNFGMDTAADYTKWLKENRVFGISGKFNGSAFGYDYKGQMDQSGYRAIDRTFKLDTDQSEKRALRASIFYKVRTMPWDEQVMIRNFSITARPAKNLEVTNQLQTNPEVPNGNSLLGSTTQAASSNKWKIDYRQNANLTFGASWEELINDQTKARARTTGVNLKLFEKTGSPLTVFYGLEQTSQTDLNRITTRYHLQYDQKAGPNQVFSFFVGNISYQHSVADGYNTNNWSFRLDYQFRF